MDPVPMTDATETADEDAPLRGQARVGAERRAAIVDAAIDVFTVRGFRGGALAEVAQRVGMTPQGILYHFGSKEALLVAVLAERDRQRAEVLNEVWEQAAGRGTLALFRGAARFAAMSEREHGLASLHTVLQTENFEPDHPAHAYFRERNRGLRTVTEQVLRLAQEHGEVRAEVDCAAKAREWVAFLDGAATLWLMDRSVSLVELYERFADSFVASVAVSLIDHSG